MVLYVLVTVPLSNVTFQTFSPSSLTHRLSWGFVFLKSLLILTMCLLSTWLLEESCRFASWAAWLLGSPGVPLGATRPRQAAEVRCWLVSLHAFPSADLSGIVLSLGAAGFWAVFSVCAWQREGGTQGWRTSSPGSARQAGW